MGIKDVIKNSVLDAFSGSSGFSFSRIALMLGCAMLIGLYIYIFYRCKAKSGFYSKDFNVTLAALPVVVAAIMIAMQANLVVSLGMVGALSIVRFRTAVKNPIDLLYLFWGISGGIVIGVGLYVLAAALCVFMTVTILIAGCINFGKSPSLVIIKVEYSIDNKIIEETVNKHCSYFKKASMIIRDSEKELIYEVVTKSENELMDEIGKIKGLLSANYLETGGEIRG